MEPLLKTVARQYSQRYDNLKRICFIFPNKRCGVFIRKYFDEFDIHTEDLPHIHTISSFVSQVAKKSEASRITQLFSLYKSYIEILKKDSNDEVLIEFEDFRIWGETVLSDFNTVDINLVEPDEIFKNIRDYRELSTNFLTEDQKDVMREYFGVEPDLDTNSFWKNFEDPENISELKNKYLNLWQILAPLHANFVAELDKENQATVGMIYKKAAEKILEKGKDALPYKKIVIVGFNALTESERTIFKTLREETGYPEYDEFIDFIWDSYGPILEDQYFTASRFVDYNKKQFPSPSWFVIDNGVSVDISSKQNGSHIEKNDKWYNIPQINIITAPTNTSQTKIAGEILKRYVTDEGAKKINKSEIALILPDESLLSNMLFSFPNEIEDINVTMGVSLRHSALAGFMSLLRRVYVSAREKEDDRILYVKDLRLLFTHPYSYILFDGQEIAEFLSFLDDNHLVTISLKEISDFLTQAEELFSFPKKNNKDEEIFSFLKRILIQLLNNLNSENRKDSDTNEIFFIETYLAYVDELEREIKKFGIKTLPLSTFSLINKMVGGEKIGFEGEPLSGLQVMGTLETRCLDFKDIIVLSMNEGTMPAKAHASTFIPDSLRKAYGLPPSRYAEEIFAYYFYRLISRAQRVTLIYDGRTISGMKGGESRYLLQLKYYLPKEKIKEEVWQYGLETHPLEKISVHKTPDIKELLNLYCSTDNSKKNLSSSTLNNFRECQIKFLLQNVLNINSDPERSEYMDPITIGNVLHEVMLWIYFPEKDYGKLLKQPIEITKSFIENILNDSGFLKILIQKSIQKQYYGDRDGTKKKVESGVTDMLAEQIEDMIRIILHHDLKLVPFKMYGGELKKKLRVKLSSGREVNFNFAIDRLDEINTDEGKQLRIVDYKTGSRKLTATDLDEVFRGGYSNEQIFQLFNYAWLLGKLGVEGWENVLMEIYYLPALSKGERSLPKFDDTEVLSFGPYKDEYNIRLEQLIENIFSDDPFMQSTSSSECTYCGFKNFCMK